MVAFAATTATVTFGVGLSIPTVSATSATYTIVSGDSLIGISSKLHVTLSALLEANNLSRTSVIHPGQKLVVPAGGSPISAPVAATPVPAPVAAPVAAPAAPRTYTVVSGDSLYGISSKLKVTLTALLEANRLTRTSVIHPGKVLVVPASAPAAIIGTPTPAAAAPMSPASPSAVATQLVYVVQRNDFLIGIASMLGVSLDSLLSTNKLVRTSVILPGQKLLVPAGGRLPTIVAAPAAAAPVPTAGLDARIAKVLDYARAQLGKPYRFGMAGPDSFDCSGLTKMAYATINVGLPHYSAAQAERGNAVNWTSQAIKPGDLVFLADSPTSTIDHVGIAISSTQWIHAPRTGDVVRIGTIPVTRVVSVRRLVDAA